MVRLILFKLLLVGCVCCVQAQVQSAGNVINTAQTDAKKFKLNKADFKQFRKNRKNSTSDWFKPTTGKVSDTTLLVDSVYVKAYRVAAYRKTLKRRTVGHYFLVGGLAYVAATLAATFIVLFVLLAKASK